MIILLFVLGLIIGSFLGAWSYRYPRKLSVLKGRSQCNWCGKKLRTRDNIPVVSFVLLGGKSSCCGHRLGYRETAIELVTAIVFVIFGPSPFSLFVASLMIGAFVVDLENMVIPDEVFIFGLVATLFYFILMHSPIYDHFLAGLLAGLFLLFLHLVTRGRGMGLGDVKLAVFDGTFLGLLAAFWWMLASFVIGGVFGVFLVLANKKKMSEKIAFGPFLVVGFFLVWYLQRMNLLVFRLF